MLCFFPLFRQIKQANSIACTLSGNRHLMITRRRNFKPLTLAKNTFIETNLVTTVLSYTCQRMLRSWKRRKCKKADPIDLLVQPSYLSHPAICKFEVGYMCEFAHTTPTLKFNFFPYSYVTGKMSTFYYWLQPKCC